MAAPRLRGAEIARTREAEPRQIDQQLSAAPPGSDGLTFRPLLGSFGATGVAAETKGCLDGLQLAHGPAHVLRSVVEGLACELNRHLDFLRHGGLAVERLLMTAGAATSEVTPQVIADVTGLPVICHADVAGSLRARRFSRSMLPGQRSLRELAQTMALPGKTIQPGADAAFYQRQFQQYVRSLPLLAAETTPR